MYVIVPNYTVKHSFVCCCEIYFVAVCCMAFPWDMWINITPHNTNDRWKWFYRKPAQCNDFVGPLTETRMIQSSYTSENSTKAWVTAPESCFPRASRPTDRQLLQKVSFPSVLTSWENLESFSFLGLLTICALC